MKRVPIDQDRIRQLKGVAKLEALDMYHIWLQEVRQMEKLNLEKRINKTYYTRHKEYLKAASKRYYQAHKDYFKEYHNKRRQAESKLKT